jgi:hypothetical protein
MVRVPVTQEYPKSDKTVGIDSGWSLKLPVHLIQESRSNYRKKRFIDAPQTHLHTVAYPWHKCQQVKVELYKKVRPRYQPTLTDNLPFDGVLRVSQ